MYTDKTLGITVIMYGYGYLVRGEMIETYFTNDLFFQSIN